MNHLVLSSSLHPRSRSRVLATRAFAALGAMKVEASLIDARDMQLPMCDGDGAWDNEHVAKLKAAIDAADGVILGMGVYNYSASAAAKSLVELGGSAWNDKIVGFACASGGSGSYMAAMGLANSLMLDFRCVIVPRLVFATGAAIEGDELVDVEIVRRIDALAQDIVRMTTALRSGDRDTPTVETIAKISRVAKPMR